MTFPAHTKRAHFELFGGDKIGSNHSSSFSTCLRPITPEVKRTFSSRDANLVLKIESKEDLNFSFLCGRNVSLHQMAVHFECSRKRREFIKYVKLTEDESHSVPSCKICDRFQMLTHVSSASEVTYD